MSKLFENVSLIFLILLSNIFLLPFIFSGLLTYSLSYILLFCFILTPSIIYFFELKKLIPSFFIRNYIPPSLIFIHGILSIYFFNNTGAANLLKFFFSICYLIILLFFCIPNLAIIKKIKLHKIYQTFNFFFYVIFFGACLSAAGVLFLHNGGRPVFYYGEPSHFVLAFTPFIIYKFITAKKQELLFFSAICFELALLFPSAIFIFIVLILPVIFYRPKITSNIYLIYIIVLLLNHLNYSSFLITSDNMKYFSDRLPTNTSANNNLSLEVFYSGWSRAYLNTIDTYGIGIGFQQLGYLGAVDSYLLNIKTTNSPFGLHDGGSFGAKFVNEFGIFAIILLILYLRGCVKKALNIRVFLVAKKHQYFHTLSFLMDIFYLSFFVPLFLRSTGYFGPIFLVFCLALFYENRLLKKPSKRHDI